MFQPRGLVFILHCISSTGGRYFDPFGMAEGPMYKTYKENEIKNGRLAMVAFFGFAAQHAATGKGPIENLVDVSNFVQRGLHRLMMHE